MQPKNHLQLQKKQIKSLLQEFRKNKMRCLQLCEQANQDMPDLQHYEILQITCTRKIGTLDLMTVIKLKQQLAASNISQDIGISAVAELQRELTSKLFRDNFKKVVKPPRPSHKVKEIIPEQLGPFFIPQYHSQNQTNELKIERLSKYIVTLGRSMLTLRSEITGGWKEEDFANYEPQWVQLRTKLEQYKMREEELIHIIEREYQNELKKMIEKGERVGPVTTADDGEEYQTVKIPKKRIENYGKQHTRPGHFGDLERQYHPFSMLEPKRGRRKQRQVTLERITEERHNADGEQEMEPQGNPLQRVHSQAILDGLSVNRHNMTSVGGLQDEGQNGNYVYMMKKKSPDQLNNSLLSSISSLRSLRKRVFDDDIWDQFEKM